MSNCLNNYLYVRFDRNDKQSFKLGSLELVKPLEWASRTEQGDIKTDDYGNTKFEENTNYLETKPQICEVLTANSKYPYKKGDRLFCHYMAFESSQFGDILTYEAFINASFVILTIEPDGSYTMAEDTYLAEQVLTDDEMTPNGIIINAFGGRPKLCELRVINSPKQGRFSPGEVVMSIDNYNYPCEIEGKNYIMIRDREIVGKL